MEPRSINTEQGQQGFNREQVVSLARDDLNFLAPFLMPEEFLYNFTPMHLVAWDFFLRFIIESEQANPTPKQKFPQLALGWPRGHLKTTLIKLLTIWCILFSKKSFILVVASNLDKAKNIVADICDMLGHENVKNTWGSWNILIDKNTEILKKFTFMGRDIVIGAMGAGGDPRGLNVKNKRPDIILMDDMQSREDSESPILAKKLLLWMNGTLKKAKSQHGCVFIFVGNMFSSQGCILRLIKKNPEWTKIIVPGLLADGTSLWPELRSKEELLQELREDISMGTPEVFLSEIMNDETGGLTGSFDITKVPYCPYAPPQQGLVASFIVIDVAGHKEKSDDTTIIFYEVHDGIPIASFMERGKFTPGDTIKKALSICLKNACGLVGVENVAYQASLLWWFNETCKKYNIEGIHFVELHPKGRAKNTRIVHMFRRLTGTLINDTEQTATGKPTLYIRDELRSQVFWEISQFRPHSKDNEDNIIDNLAYSEDMMQDYADLMWNPVSVESLAFQEAKVVEENYAF